MQQSQAQEVVVTISPGVLVVTLAIIIAGSFLAYKAISKNSVQGSPVAGKISDVVTTNEGKQYIAVTADGGYSPRSITAKAGIPTVLVMKTENTFGCERSFRIPKMGISQILPETGETQIDLGTQTAGSRVYGTCSMGMYSVSITFN